jgi:hypothetical protein
MSVAIKDIGAIPPQTPRIDNPTLEDLVALSKSPVHFARAVGFPNLDPWQEEVLNSDSNRVILNCCRQSGKSAMASIIAITHALYTPGSMVIIISHTLQQAGETFRKVHDYYKRVARPVISITESVHRLELSNGSRVVTLTGKAPDSIRGFSNVSLLIVDEASQVPDESYHAARPMLAVSEGRIILLSTPHGKQGFFYDTWANKEGWLKIEINADQVPRFTKAFIWDEKMTMVGWFFRQEYYNEFAEGITSVFRAEDIKAALNHPELKVLDIDMSLDDL